MIRINPNSSTPIYEQIVDGFKEHILMGRLKPGDIIPSVRRLAVEVGINPNTVGKAYQEMERLGMIRTQRGKGAYVAASELQRNETQALRAELKKLAEKMHSYGFGDAQIAEMLLSVLEELKQQSR